MDILADPTLLLVATAAYFIGGLLKGALGFGLPVLGVPLVTVAHSLPMALSLAIVPVVVTNIAQLWLFRAQRGLPFLPGFLICGALGLCIGATMLSQFDNAYIEIALGCMVLLYLASRLGPRAGHGGRTDRAWAFGLLAGAVHGATGLSGLVGSPYLCSLNLPRPAFVFAIGAMFTAFSLIQAPVLILFGLFETDALRVSLFVLPVAFLGLYLGGLIGGRMEAQKFSRLVFAVLTITAILPIVNGVRSLSGV
ncbi:MAG: sulfite exporter TauE/SafE family protein [Pseudomonadota bacterium]